MRMGIWKDNIQTPQSDTELSSTGWPWQGGIQFVDARMRYREDFEPVLKGVTLNIRPEERIGIVGTTGSGKSSSITIFLKSCFDLC